MKFLKKAPQKHKKQRIRKAEELVILRYLSQYLDLHSSELARFLVWGLEKDSDFVTYEELREICASQKITEKQMELWRGKYAEYVKINIVPLWEKAMTEAVSDLTGSVFSSPFSSPLVYAPAQSLFVSHLQTQSAKLVTVVTEPVREVLTHLMGQLGGVEGLSPYKMSQYIRPLIGLNLPQAIANRNYFEAIRNSLLENNPSMSTLEAEARASALAKTKAEKQHRYRAMMIARTELANSYNAGQHLAVEDAMRQGLLGDMVKVWCTAEDERMCPHCGAMEGQVRELKEAFSCGVLVPTAHPHCRCAVLYEDRELHSGLTSGLNGGRMENDRNPRNSGALDSYSQQAGKHAEQYYDSVRKMRTDCKRISANTGFSLVYVEAVKKHLFMTKHDLGGSELEYFYPDYDIAQSWQRLMLNANTIEPIDLLLLQHEFEEQMYMSMGMSQREAHEKANEKYNYQIALKEKDEEL